MNAIPLLVEFTKVENIFAKTTSSFPFALSLHEVITEILSNSTHQNHSLTTWRSYTKHVNTKDKCQIMDNTTVIRCFERLSLNFFYFEIPFENADSSQLRQTDYIGHYVIKLISLPTIQGKAMHRLGIGYRS